MGAQPSTEADPDGDEEDIFPSIKRNSSYLVSSTHTGAEVGAQEEAMSGRVG